MADSILRLQNISKYYYSDTTVTQALRRISLEFSVGEFVAITGESGGGKSTLLNMISGLDFFDEGEMYFRGEPTFQFDEKDWEEYRRNQIGFIFQDYSLISHYSALDNVLAALVIQGKSAKEAKEEARSYLEQVGLKEFAAQRASQLSSGQKQRLSIARALAKNTDIIVADEPTGNLDSETGRQVIELLQKLSRKKLVIMVTHNYDQAEPYVTRKIRLHDGEVVTDTPVNHTSLESSGDMTESVQLEPTEEDSGELSVKNGDMTGLVRLEPAEEDSEEFSMGSRDVAVPEEQKQGFQPFFFAKRNISTQRVRGALFFSFFLITAVVSFLFIGELLTYADDRITKEYDTTAFLQENDTRLVVRHPDNARMTEEDARRIASVKNVEQVDIYDYANDVNYYIEEDRDYKILHEDAKEVEVEESESTAGESGKEETSLVRMEGNSVLQFLDKSHFMRSSLAISESELSQGRLPESRMEIVLYSPDKDILNSKVTCYFTSDNLWEPGESCSQELTVVGLLKDKTEQVYFSPILCRMFTVGLDGYSYRLKYDWDFLTEKFKSTMKQLYPIINDDLEGEEIRGSKNFSSASNQVDANWSERMESVPSLHAGEGEIDIILSEKEDAQQEEESVGEMQMEGDTEYREASEEEETEGEEEQQMELPVQIQSKYNDYGAYFVEVSQEVFDKLYQGDTTQASVYISSYGKTDQVIQALSEMGYEAASTYRISTTKYVDSKVYQRLEVIGISVLVLLVLVVLQVLILRSILKIKIKEYDILKFMGMRMEQMKKITYLEMAVHCVAALLLAAVLMACGYALKLPVLVEMIPYYSILGIFVYILYNVLLMCLTVSSFNRMLGRLRS